MDNTHECETPMSDLVRSALDKMKSGEWFLTLTHPNPAEGSAHFGTDVAVALAAALSPSPSPDMREAVEALRMVEEWWLTEGMHEPGRIGAPAAIFKARAALRSITGAKP